MVQRKKKLTSNGTPAVPGDDEVTKDLTKYVATKQAAKMMGVATDHINHLLVAEKN